MKVIFFVIFLFLYTFSYSQVNEIYIPNSFTPNNDGINDYIQVISESEFDLFKFQIYSTYGELVFNTENPYEVWGGGNQYYSNNSIFVYKLQYRIKGTSQGGVKYGHINLIR